MKNKKILVTGSCGLVGSEIVNLFKNDYKYIFGIDNNQRKIFLAKEVI